MQNNKVIAVTGGIGSGKSTCLKIIEKLGYKSINADLVYRELLLNEDFVQKICDAFTILPIYENGVKKIDKNALANIVFNDKSKLEKLNSITHPEIINEILKRANSISGLVFCEIPLLYEGNFDKLFNYVLVIKRKDDERISAVQYRDGKTESQVKNIIKNQFDYTKIRQNEHTFIIENNCDEIALTEKIKDAIKQIS